MAEFSKYPSIENVKTSRVAKFLETAPSADEEWVVVEKLHGSNLAFSKARGDEKLYVHSRNRLLGDVDTYDHVAMGFFNCGYWFKNWKQQLVSLADELLESKLSEEIVKQVNIYGELCGGHYDCKDVEKDPEGRVIQSGQLQYAPQNLFYGFDIKLISETGKLKFLDFDTVQNLFNKHGIFCEQPQFRGTLVDCINFSSTSKLMNTEIPQRLGLHEREPNVREGNVIKPVIARFLSSGSRVILKDKNDHESFGTSESKKARKKFTRVDPNQTLTLENELLVFMNVDRYQSALSKLGPVANDRKKIGIMIGEMVSDLIEELKRDENPLYDQYDGLVGHTKKTVKAKLSLAANEIIKAQMALEMVEQQ